VADPPKSVVLTPELHEYLVEHGTPLDDVQRWLISETKAKAGDFAGMQIAPEQGAFMTVLTRLLGARQAVEVGTFTGASALAVARGLPPGGRLLCCDVSEEWTAVAREAWQRAGVADRIELRIGPAVDTLRSLPEDFTVDLAFVDADKTNYPAYYEELLGRLRPNGVMLIDNTLWHGAVIDSSAQDDSTKAIRAFNDAVAADDRVDTVLLPISDGVTMIRKR
jgi:caffeoyl-CoA O-methyltransferase